MPTIALTIYVFFLAVAVVGRAALQYRRTGDHGIQRLLARPGSIEWWTNLTLLIGMPLPAVAAFGAYIGHLGPLVDAGAFGIDRIGLALMVAGFITVVAAQLQMRDSWRIGVDRQEVTPLVKRGLFSIVRNPIYSGVLLASAGLLFTIPNVLSVMAFAMLCAGLEVQVRFVEEPYLIRVHGETYLTYARKVGRFVPGVGRL